MRRIRILDLVLLTLTSFGTPVSTLTFHGVPLGCEIDLTAIRGEMTANRPVDWQPWVVHLRRSGYAEKHVEQIILRERKEDPGQLLARIRRTLNRPDWTWEDGLDADQSGLVAASYDVYARIPFEYLAEVPGFDGPAALTRFLAKQSDHALGEEAVRRLSLYAPFWSKDPGALSLAQLLLSKVDYEEIISTHRWLRQTLSTADQAILRTSALSTLSKIQYFDRAPEDVLFQALDHVRLSDLEPWERRRLRWALPLGRRAADLEREDGIRVVSRGVKAAGHCALMSFGHLRLLWPAKTSRYRYTSLKLRWSCA